MAVFTARVCLRVHGLFTAHVHGRGYRCVHGRVYGLCICPSTGYGCVHDVARAWPRTRVHDGVRAVYTTMYIKVKVKVGFLYSTTYMVDQEQRTFTIS